MDEVEPALDDVNLHRFLRLVEGFSKTSQVMIVTHQKRTMEIAGMMYGVSMNKDGTSKIVCQAIDEPKTASEGAPSTAFASTPEVVEVPESEPVH
jgi:chromosome segregation ATPase